MEAQKEKKSPKRNNLKRSLLKVKDKLDGILKNLESYPDLSSQAKDLREKVFNKFVEEEKNIAV